MTQIQQRWITSLLATIVSISFTSCNLQLSRYDTLIFCCTPSIIGKCPIFYIKSKTLQLLRHNLLFANFFKYAINCPLFVSASVKVNLCVLFFWYSFHPHLDFIFLASVFSRTDNTSIHPYINWCFQTIVTCKKGNALLHSYFSMSTRYLWLFSRLNRFLHQPQWPQGGTGHCSGLKTVQPWHWPQCSASSYFGENIT